MKRYRAAFATPYRPPVTTTRKPKSGASKGGRTRTKKRTTKPKNNRFNDYAKTFFGAVVAGAAARADKELVNKLQDKVKTFRRWLAPIQYGDKRDDVTVPAYQTNTIRRTQEDSRNHYTKNVFGANGSKLRQLKKLYGMKKVIVNNSKEQSHLNGLPSYDTGHTVSAQKNQLTNIDFGFNQKLWLFPLRANIDISTIKSQFNDVMYNSETNLTRTYGHILSTESQIEIATSNAFLPTRVTVHTCSFKESFLEYDVMYEQMIPQNYDNISVGAGQFNFTQSSIAQKYLLEPRMQNNNVANQVNRDYGALTALVDPKTKFNYSRWFARHVNILKSDSRILGPGDVWTYTNIHNFKNPINLNYVTPVSIGSAVPFDTFFIVECVGLKTTLYNKTYKESDDLTPYVGTSPGQINMELRTAMTGVVRPTPLNVDDGSATSTLYQGAFSSQVIHIEDKPDSRITNLSREKIGTRTEVFDPTNDVQAFIPVTTDEQTAYSRVITAPPEPTRTDEVVP